MKKTIVIALCAIMTFSCVACGAKSKNDAIGDTTNESGSAEVQVPNPFVTCETLEEAEKLAGFTITVPEKIENSSERIFRAMEGQLLEIIYMDGEEEVARIRKAPGSDDISGDYNQYTDTTEVTVGEWKYTLKGNDGKVSVATWVDGDYTYSVSVNEMSSEAALEIAYVITTR